jgi:radical SAM protein with 4Fe4S-binding SPASM domain
MANWNEGLLWIRKQSPARLGNALRIWKSYHTSKLQGKPKISGLPLSISIEPTTSCNLRCPECPSGLRSFTRPTGMLQEKVFTSVIDELAPVLTNLTFYFQGEPYLNPKFLEMVEYASHKKVFTSTSTNAHYLNDEQARKTVESRLDRLIISIDGVSQETYEQYRVGGQLSKVLEGTKNIVAWKRKLKSKTPHVVFQFLVVKANEQDIPRLYSLAKEMGVDEVKLKTAQIYEFENGSPLLPENPKYSRYQQQDNGKYTIKSSMQNQCWKMWSSSVITWDGKVVPCCFDKDAQHVMGDVTKQSFAEIWQNDKYNAFRQSILRSRSEIEICKNCSEGLEVWA